MKPMVIVRRMGLAAIVVLSAGCTAETGTQSLTGSTTAVGSTAEPAGTTASSTVTDSFGASSSGAEVSTERPTPEPTPEAVATSEPVPATSDLSTPTNHIFATGPAAPMPPMSTSAAPGAGAVPPATFPDPTRVEALGYATNPLCEALSADEVSLLLGTAVEPAVDDAAGTGCLWNGVASSRDFLQLQMVGDPARYAAPAGAELVPGIGDAAYVGATDGGWTAQAQNPDGTFAVRVSGATAVKDAAVEGLRRLLERY